MRRFLYVFFLFSADYYRLILYISAQDSDIRFNSENNNDALYNNYFQNFLSKPLTNFDDESFEYDKQKRKKKIDVPHLRVAIQTLKHNKNYSVNDETTLSNQTDLGRRKILPSDTKFETHKKIGQSEFVEFVEPLKNKELKNVEFLSKRVPVSNLFSQHDGLSFIPTSGNLVFLAFIAMCCVLSLIGIVGGIYYYNHIRKTNEDSLDDFTRYSPAGPGRIRLKKNVNGQGANNDSNYPSEINGNKGDESLAYKAQLHHYQQTKQKIIGGDSDSINWRRNVMSEGVNLSEKSDEDEEDGDLEHNFSVYECPGLAPTGDIEVQNPNFVEHDVK